MKNLDHLPYRAGVGIVLINNDRKVFIGERIDNPGAWQLPQGGIDPGEDIETAFFRELKEETGSDDADILEIMDSSLRYDFPAHTQARLYGGKYRGQEQTWVAAKFLGDDKDINIAWHNQQEFRAWRWISPQELLEIIVPFKRATYETVLKHFEKFTQ